MRDPDARVLLLVVDNPAHRVMLTRYLGKTPHHLVYSTDGEDGYDRFAEVKPDLVIAHLNVARLDGTILCQLLRQQPRGDTVPVLLIGDESEDERIHKRIEAVGADGYLAVPFSGKLLLDAIGPLLAEGRRPKLEVILEPPTLPLSTALDLKLAPVGGLDFPDRTDGPTTDSGMPASLMDSGDLPVPAVPSEHVDVDTVVSFQNPFYEGPPSTTLKAEAPHVPLPEIIEASGPFGAEPSGVVVAPVLDADVTGAIGSSPVPRMDSVLMADTSSEPLPPSGILDEQLISASGAPAVRDADKKDLSTKSRMLVEPAIGGGTGVGKEPAKEAFKEPSHKSRLIQELPRDDRTPTGEAGAKGGAVSAAAGVAVRRGLDESQLGKRLAKRVRSMHRLLDEVDYYQLLGVEPGATLAQLKAAYFDLSLEFHPDRFFLLRSGDLKEKIYAIYRRIAEAHAVLADEALRRGYDESRQQRISGTGPIVAEVPPPPPRLEAPMVPAGPEDIRARELAAIAELALNEGDLDRARLFLHLARHYEPNKAALEVVLAKVVARLGPSL